MTIPDTCGLEVIVISYLNEGFVQSHLRISSVHRPRTHLEFRTTHWIHPLFNNPTRLFVLLTVLLFSSETILQVRLGLFVS